MLFTEILPTALTSYYGGVTIVELPLGFGYVDQGHAFEALFHHSLALF